MSDLLKPLEQKYFISGEINSKVADPVSKIKQLTKNTMTVNKICWMVLRCFIMIGTSTSEFQIQNRC